MLKRINCSHCGHLLSWKPELLKQNKPGYTLRCLETNCQTEQKIQDFILLEQLLDPTKNPLAHFKLEDLV